MIDKVSPEVQQPGLGFRVWGLGFRVWGSGFRFRVSPLPNPDTQQPRQFRIWRAGTSKSDYSVAFREHGHPKVRADAHLAERLQKQRRQFRGRERGHAGAYARARFRTPRDNMYLLPLTLPLTHCLWNIPRLLWDL